MPRAVSISISNSTATQQLSLRLFVTSSTRLRCKRGAASRHRGRQNTNSCRESQFPAPNFYFNPEINILQNTTTQQRFFSFRPQKHDVSLIIPKSRSYLSDQVKSHCQRSRGDHRRRQDMDHVMSFSQFPSFSAVQWTSPATRQRVSGTPADIRSPVQAIARGMMSSTRILSYAQRLGRVISGRFTSRIPRRVLVGGG